MPPLYAFVELIAFFGIVALLEWVYPLVGDVQEITPHPFWLVVLLLSLQYGTLSGLLAAFCAVLMSYTIGWPQADINENHFNYLVRIWTQPVLWIAAALLIGQFRMRQLTQRAELRRTIGELSDQRDRISGYADGLRQRCNELERQLATRPETMSEKALESFQALGDASPANCSEPLAAVAQQLLYRAQCSLFVLAADGLRLQASTTEGTAFGANGKRLGFGPADPLYVAICNEGRALSILEANDQASLEGEGLLAVPVMLPSTGAIAGMLKVEFIDPVHLDAASLPRLSLVATQLGRALERYTLGAAASAAGPAAGRRFARVVEPIAEFADGPRIPLNVVR